MKLPFILLFLLVFLIPMSLVATVWNVNPDGTGDAPTIQAAIDSTSPGDSIIVGAGLYYISDIIRVFLQDSLYISGESDPAVTILDGQNNIAPFVIQSCNNIVLCNFTFRHFSNGPILVQMCDGNIQISNNIIHDINGTGITIEASDGISIIQNLIFNNENGISTGDCCYNIILSNNTIAFNGNNGYGLFLDSMPCGSYLLTNNLVVGNDYGIFSYCLNIGFTCNNVFGNYNDFAIFVDIPTGQNGNISNEPEFCSTSPETTFNFELQSDSPCAPNNHPDGYSCGYIGNGIIGCSTTSIIIKSWGSLKGEQIK